LFGLFGLLLSSCGGSVADDSYRIVDRQAAPVQVEVSPGEATFTFSEHFSSCDTVSLSGCLMSYPAQLYTLEDGRMILRAKIVQKTTDGDMVSMVGVFSSEGELLGTVAREGRGPEEMIDVVSIKPNPYLGTIDVLGFSGTKVYRYDAKTLEKRDEFSVLESDIVAAENFMPVDAERYLFYKNLSYSTKEEYKLNLYNVKTGAVEKTFLPLDKKVAESLSFVQNNHLSTCGGEILFAEGFLPVVYKYADTELKPYVGLNYGKHEVTESELKADYGGDVVRLCEYLDGADRIYGHDSFYCTDNEIFSAFYYRGPSYLNVISMSEGVSATYSRMNDDMVLKREVAWKKFEYTIVGSDKDAVYFLADRGDKNSLLIKASVKKH